MTKKIMNMLFIWLWAVGMMAQSGAGTGGSGSGADEGLYTVSTAITPSRAGAVSYSGYSYKAGDQVYLYTEPNSSYRFKYWLEGDTQVSTETTFYYTMPARNVTLTAVYEYDPASPANPTVPGILTLKASPSRAGTFSPSSGQYYQEGTNLRLYAYARENYKFNHWEYKGEVVSENYWCDFTMPANGAELVAVFTYNPANPSNPGTNPWDEKSGQLIIDDFEEGNLYSAVCDATGNSEKMQSLIVSGRVTSSDIRDMSQFPFADIDFSRCAGATEIYSWSFEQNAHLTTISLPASITNIYSNAFNGCSSLTVLNCYATTPPILGTNVFAGVPEGLTVYVPANSVSLYESASGWDTEDINILPFGEQVSALEVDLPENATDGRFRNMYIEIVNATSGQRMRNVISDRVAYTFNNLMFNTTWHIYVKNATDQMLGHFDNFEIGNDPKGYVYPFQSLLEPQTITAKVLAGNEDLTSQVQLTWRDANGTYIGQGTSISGILPIEGMTVSLRTTLPQTLAMKYQLPEDVTCEVKESDNLITVELQPLPAALLTGRVCDVKNDNIIPDAIVTLSQTLNGIYTTTFRGKTDAQGIYHIQAFDAPSSVTAVASDYISATQTYDELTLDNGVATLEDLKLKSINGAQITLVYKYMLSAEPGKTPETREFNDVQNVSYTIYNVTADKPIKEFNVQYPLIVLLEDVAAGDELRITAESRTGAFKTVEATGKVNAYADAATVTFNIKQLGQIKATYSYTENPGVTGILYDNRDKFVRSDSYDNATLLFTDLADGNYKLVTMGSSKLFNTIYDLSKFEQAGLVEGKDYVLRSVIVESGVIKPVSIASVPFFDESKLYYTGDNTNFTVNKNQLTAGTYLTMNGRIDFKKGFLDEISDVHFVVDLPENCSLVANSVMVGTSLGSYTYDEETNRISIPVSKWGDRVRFCVIPTQGGDYAPSAYAQFTYNAQEVNQPIGQAPFKVEDLTISVPAVVSSPTLPVNGSAFGKSRVQIFDNGIFIGETTALANGSWATSCQLIDPEDDSKHSIHALVTTPTGLEMLSQTKTVVYDEDAIEVDNVTMYYSNPEVNGWRGKNYQMEFDFRNPSTRPFTYVYYIYNRSFTFTLKFTKEGKSNVKDVFIMVKTGDGRWHDLQPEYNERKNQFVISSNFGNMYDGIVPVNVGVRYTPIYNEVAGDPVVVYSGYPDCDVPIDPSGYVYEAVPSNRLQGVTATCYYKETVEDMYGDIHENVVLWNAAEYAQENPLFTDEDGFYRWDVPQGLWQVKFEKEGYVTTYSDWLPVPPPQLDVNVAMVQDRQPNVKNATILEDGVEIEFDKYMMPESLNTENIQVSINGVKVAGEIQFLDEEKNIPEGNNNAEPLLARRKLFAVQESPTYVSKVKFLIPDNTSITVEDKVEINVNTLVKSYAGLNMQDAYNQEKDREYLVSEITATEQVVVGNGNKTSLLVAVLPTEATKDKVLRIVPQSVDIVKLEGLELQDGAYTVPLNADGQAELSVFGDMPGNTALQLSVVDTEVEKNVSVKVTKTFYTESHAPIPSRGTGSKLYRGTKVSLRCDDPDAVIRYTTDGTEPTENSDKYTVPIAINEDMTIKAFAKSEGVDASAVQTFEYTIRTSNQEVSLNTGWNWISHNVNTSVAVNTLPDAVQEIKSQTRSAIRDNVYGLFGNLSTLQPTEAYKVKVSEATYFPVSGDAFNTSTGVINIHKGWNWLSYPLEAALKPAVALANYPGTQGDILVGQGVSAEYVDGEWMAGDVDFMHPGCGYMLKAAQPVEFLYNATYVSKDFAQTRGRLNFSHVPWSVDIYAYPNIMAVRAQLYREDTPTSEGEYTVAAFAGTECRGIGNYVKGVIFMNVTGEGNEEISFLAANNETEEIVTVNETVNFNGDVLGSYREPYLLHLGEEADGIEAHNSLFGVWPTMATTEINVSLGGKSIDRLTLTGADGKTVFTSTSGATQQTIRVSNLPAGIYIVAAQSGNEYFYRKVMKVNK